jgi:hypothetical protein
MAAKVTDDYSSFPIPIQEVMPFVEGGVTELRNHWQIHYALFMEDKAKTSFYAESFGPMFGIFQNLLAKEMILAIGRLTDEDKINKKAPHKSQHNLSIWRLKEAIPFAKSNDFVIKVESTSKAIKKITSNPRMRRHKEIAHSDLNVSLGKSPAPTVLFKDIRSTLETMEVFLNLFHWEFARTTVGYDSLSSGMLIENALMTAIKSKVYDELETEKIIPLGEWERRVDKWPWWKWH